MITRIGIIGPGGVGGEFLDQVKAYLDRQHTPGLPTLSVHGIINSKAMLLSPSPGIPIDLADWRSDLAQAEKATDLHTFIQQLIPLPGTRTVIVDCTCSDTIANMYPDWLSKSMHIVTPNKKAFSGDENLFDRIRKAEIMGDVKAYHESTVGAGLPVLSTLRNLVDTGDEVYKIEGILSGTLSYLFNTFSTSENYSFSDTVKKAKELGYTEPDPRDDLNGIDFARKLVILGRLAGMKGVSLSTVFVENIVPEPLRALDVTCFMDQLPIFDAYFDQKRKAAASVNGVLRYMGSVDVSAGVIQVALKQIPASHPFASLSGSDNVIAFTTRRFPSPLLIQGAGAGAAVTAFGIFSDVLTIARCG